MTSRKPNTPSLGTERMIAHQLGPEQDRRARLAVVSSMRESGYSDEAILDVLGALALLPGTEHERAGSGVSLTNRTREKGCVPTIRDSYVPS